MSKTPRITLTAICGNEEIHAERWLESFAPACDEIVIARAIGGMKPDGTIRILQDGCKRRGVKFRWVEYRNGPGAETWPGVDNFAAARNASLELATGDVIFWADFDDILADPKPVRECAAAIWSGKYEYETKPDAEPYMDERRVPACHVFCVYELPTQQETVWRERIFTRTCKPRWTGAIHENLHQTVPAIRIKSESIRFVHYPLENKDKDPERNLRILAKAAAPAMETVYELGRQSYIDGLRKRDDRLLSQSARNLTVSVADPILPTERQYAAHLMLADIDARRGKTNDALDRLWRAVRLYPNYRDAYAQMAEIELASRRPTRALSVVMAMINQPRPAAGGYPVSERFYRWFAADLLTRTRRGCGQDPEQSIHDAAAKSGGYRFALLHATRGRFEQAVLTRKAFMESARQPERIWHIFASDDDDPDTERLAAHGHRLIVNPGQTCVSAWNLAAEQAAELSIPVLIQLSDDWSPSMYWDEPLWEIITNAGDPVTKEMAVKVGGNPPHLMTMAVCSLARYRKQGHLFAPDYESMYSDNEYTHRAERDGIVIDAQRVMFRHRHPVFGTAEVDETYRRQNDPAKYERGLEAFLRRNPEAKPLIEPVTATEPEKHHE